MYEQYYGLREKPFSLLPDPDYLYPSDKHQMALSLLEYSLLNQAGFCVISGETGAGKTTLIRRVLSQLGDNVTVGLISNTHPGFGELLRWILMAFDLDHTHKDKVQLYQTFIDFLIDQYAANRNSVLIVDEAQNMAPDTLEELRMLSNVNADKDQVIQVILVGQPGLRRTLQRKDLEQFAQRIAVDYHIEPLDGAETRGYIRHRLQVAGGDGALFSDEACDRVYRYSGGIPRLINLICDTTLVYGYAEQTRTIPARLVDDVVRDREKQGVLPRFPLASEAGVPPASREDDASLPGASADAIHETPASDDARAARRSATGHRPEPQASDSRAVAEKPVVQVVATGAGRAGAVVLKDRGADGDAARVVRAQAGAGATDLDGGTGGGLADLAKRGGTVHAIHRSESRAVEASAAGGGDGGHDDDTQTVAHRAPPAFATGHAETSAGIQGERRREHAAKPASEAAAGPAAHGGEATAGADRIQPDRVTIAMAQDKTAGVLGDSPDRRWAWSALGFAGGMMMTAVLIVVLVFSGFGSPSELLRSGSARTDGVPVAGGIMPMPLASSEATVPPGAAAALPVEPLESARALERERDAALAEIRALERERDAALMAARARERAEAAEIEATRARERERAAALEAAKALERVRAAELAAQEARERERAAALEAAKVLERPRAPELKTPPVSPPAERSAGTTEPSGGVDSAAAEAPADATRASEEKSTLQFSANPCKGPSAKFLSTCKE
ncbi:MAG TPA: AAA family ATPase [Acidiferrobacterales bacterium]